MTKRSSTPGTMALPTPAFAATLLLLLLCLASTATTARAQVIGGCPTVEGCASCVPRAAKKLASPVVRSSPPPPPPARFELSKTAIDSYLNSLLDRVFDGVDKAAEAPGGMVNLGVSAATAADIGGLDGLKDLMVRAGLHRGCDIAPDRIVVGEQRLDRHGRVAQEAAARGRELRRDASHDCFLGGRCR